MNVNYWITRNYVPLDKLVRVRRTRELLPVPRKNQWLENVRGSRIIFISFRGNGTIRFRESEACRGVLARNILGKASAHLWTVGLGLPTFDNTKFHFSRHNSADSRQLAFDASSPSVNATFHGAHGVLRVFESFHGRSRFFANATTTEPRPNDLSRSCSTTSFVARRNGSDPSCTVSGIEFVVEGRSNDSIEGRSKDTRFEIFFSELISTMKHRCNDCDTRTKNTSQRVVL